MEATKEHHLSPVRHMRLESILAFDQDEVTSEAAAAGRQPRVTGLFARLARETSGIQDLAAMMDSHPMPESLPWRFLLRCG
ncbi:hypothetical protein [Kitasatospora sp. NPDC059571]|uniref:hypothetical protein n=1 Tax=Kitasatospora sp. NPDC059571 TaxID=3346871 RepID=UPI0036AC7E7C